VASKTQSRACRRQSKIIAGRKRRRGADACNEGLSKNTVMDIVWRNSGERGVLAGRSNAGCRRFGTLGASSWRCRAWACSISPRR